nr:DUF3152 domain-containing protein [Nakamurella flavida]
MVVLSVLVVWQAASPGGGSASGPATAAPLTQAAPSTTAPTTSPPVASSEVPPQDVAAATPPPTSTTEAVPTDGADPTPAAPDPGLPVALTADPANITADALRVPSGALPSGEPFTTTGAGTWHEVPGTGPVLGTGPRVVTYAIQVEDGIQDAAADAAFAAQVDAILADPRSWIGGGQISLQRVAGPDASFQIALTSQMTAHSNDLCGFSVQLEPSCYERDSGRVLINNSRWVRGAMAYGTDLSGYRTYVINHEVGHALGNGHQPCPVNGGQAPVMMQQSWSVANDDLAYLNPQVIPPDGKVCTANPYPFPDAVAPAAPSVVSG